MEQEMTFKEWFTLFRGQCRLFCYNGPIDKDAFLEDYEAGLSPEAAALTFVDEMNE